MNEEIKSQNIRSNTLKRKRLPLNVKYDKLLKKILF